MTTASWLSRLPVFDPGYQVLMAQGVVKEGYINVEGEMEDVSGAVVYCEKNWGTAFPRRWWWVQGGTADLAVTALGSTRITLGMEEVVGIVAVHLEGRLYEFANCTLRFLIRWKSLVGDDVLTLLFFLSVQGMLTALPGGWRGGEPGLLGRPPQTGTA